MKATRVFNVVDPLEERAMDWIGGNGGLPQGEVEKMAYSLWRQDLLRGMSPFEDCYYWARAQRVLAVRKFLGTRAIVVLQ